MNDSVGSFLSRPELSLGWVFCCRGNFVQDGPFIVREMFNHGAVVVEDPRDGRILRINGQKLKPFLGGYTRGGDYVTRDPYLLGC